MSSSNASRSPSLTACATRLEMALFSIADIGLSLPDPLSPTDYKHTVHDATRRCPVHLDAISQSRGPRARGPRGGGIASTVFRWAHALCPCRGGPLPS